VGWLWFSFGYVFVLVCIQVATVVYASLRPELCHVTVPTTEIFAGKLPTWWPRALAQWQELGPSKPEVFDRSRMVSAPEGSVMGPIMPMFASRRRVVPALRTHELLSVSVASPTLSPTAAKSSSRAITRVARHSAGEVLRSSPTATEGQAYLCRVRFSFFSWRNLIVWLMVVLELFQLGSLAWSVDTGGGQVLLWAVPPSFQQFLQDTREVLFHGYVVDTPQLTPLEVAFWAVTTFGLVYAFLCGVFIALDLMSDSPLAPILFGLLAGGGFVSVTSSAFFVIRYSPDVTHVAVCFLILLYYSSTAVFVSIYRGDAASPDGTEIRVVPRFLAIERVLKGLLSVLFIALAAWPNVRSWALVVIYTGYLGLFLRSSPSNSTGFNVIRSACLGLVWWASVVGAVAMEVAPVVGHSEDLLVGVQTALGAGSGLIITGALCSLLPYCNRCRCGYPK
jgi:hypothetical protein